MFPAFTEIGRVELALYTDSLIIRGWVTTRQQRVTDILNLSEQPFLILEDLTVEEVGDRGQPIRADIAQVNLDSILFAVADVPVEPSGELHVPKKAAEAIVSVPPYRITGMIHLLPGRNSLRESLTELTGRFIPVTNATYWSDRLGEARRTALLVAVNHHRTQILAHHVDVDPWEGLSSSGPSAPFRDAGGPRG
jgi:hypothetical protein